MEREIGPVVPDAAGSGGRAHPRPGPRRAARWTPSRPTRRPLTATRRRRPMPRLPRARPRDARRAVLERLARHEVTHPEARGCCATWARMGARAMTIDVQSSDPATGTGRISSIEHEIGPTGTLVLSIPFGKIEIHAVEGRPRGSATWASTNRCCRPTGRAGWRSAWRTACADSAGTAPRRPTCRSRCPPGRGSRSTRPPPRSGLTAWSATSASAPSPARCAWSEAAGRIDRRQCLRRCRRRRGGRGRGTPAHGLGRGGGAGGDLRACWRPTR